MTGCPLRLCAGVWIRRIASPGLLIPPDREQIEDVHYQNDKLEEIMSKYRANQSAAAAMFEKRKRDMMATPGPDPSMPYIDPSDENSKFYTKPDVPPIPHPADIVEDLRKEFPDMTMDELVKMADEKVAQIIEERKMPAVEITTVEEGDEDEVPSTPAA